MENSGQMKSGRADVSVSHGKVVYIQLMRRSTFINNCRPRNGAYNIRISIKRELQPSIYDRIRGTLIARETFTCPSLIPKGFYCNGVHKTVWIFVARASLPDFSDFPCRSPMIVFPKMEAWKRALKNKSIFKPGNSYAVSKRFCEKCREPLVFPRLFLRANWTRFCQQCGVP